MSKAATTTLYLLLALAAAAVAIIPIRLTSPFVSQTSGEISLAYHLNTWGGLLTALLLASGLFLAWHMGRRAPWWGRALLAVPLVVLIGAAILTRVNVVERMFRPLPEAGFVAADAADTVEPGAMVLGVEINGEAKAYPVPILAYHHIVHDAVGGVPIVATY